MRVKKTKGLVFCSECKKLKESYKISLSDGHAMTYLCEDCLEELIEKIADECIEE